MQIFSVLARKGGVGKSLIVRSLAVQALLDGKKAAILDADPQETIVSWSRRREPSAPFVIGLGSRPMRDALGEVEGRGGEIVFIDTPPHAQPTINIAAEVADACLLVTGPYPEDLEQVGAVASIVVQPFQAGRDNPEQKPAKGACADLGASRAHHVQDSDLPDLDHSARWPSIRIG